MMLPDRNLIRAEQRRRSIISWRKNLLLHRGPMLAAWERCFPQHDFISLRLINRADAMPGFDLSTFEKLCDEVERKAKPEASTSRPTPQSVVEAVMWCVRERGIGALREPENIRRLKECDEAARAQIDARIERLESRIAS